MPEINLDLTAFLAELENELGPKLQTIAEVRRRLGMPPWDLAPKVPAGGAPQDSIRENNTPGQVRETEFFRMSIPDAIKKYLAIMHRPQASKTIAEALKAGGILSNAKDFSAAAWTAISRLQAADAIVNTPHGWGLSEWYPSRPKGAETPKKGKKKAAKKRAAKQTAAKEAKPKKKYTIADPEQLAQSGKLGYRAFVAAQMKAGKSMAQAAQAWKEMKAGPTTTTVERNREPR